VVSTQGEGDEEALEQATLTASKGAAYISFVASRTKAAKVLDYLRQRGVPEEKLQLVRAPAGLDLGASSPEEIAVSILAEIVQIRRAQATSAQQRSAASEVLRANTEAKDPVCGMQVDTTGAIHKSEYQGRWFYFCSAGCKRKFEEMA
jgi:xanthine dehydrogenase accessory factor